MDSIRLVDKRGGSYRHNVFHGKDKESTLPRNGYARMELGIMAETEDVVLHGPKINLDQLGDVAKTLSCSRKLRSISIQACEQTNPTVWCVRRDPDPNRNPPRIRRAKRAHQNAIPPSLPP